MPSLGHGHASSCYHLMYSSEGVDTPPPCFPCLISSVSLYSFSESLERREKGLEEHFGFYTKRHAEKVWPKTVSISLYASLQMGNSKRWSIKAGRWAACQASHFGNPACRLTRAFYPLVVLLHLPPSKDISHGEGWGRQACQICHSHLQTQSTVCTAERRGRLKLFTGCKPPLQLGKQQESRGRYKTGSIISHKSAEWLGFLGRQHFSCSAHGQLAQHFSHHLLIISSQHAPGINELISASSIMLAGRARLLKNALSLLNHRTHF